MLWRARPCSSCVLRVTSREAGVRGRAVGELPGRVGQRDLRPAAAHQHAADRGGDPGAGRPRVARGARRAPRGHHACAAPTGRRWRSARSSWRPDADRAGAGARHGRRRAHDRRDAANRDDAAIASVEAGANLGLAVLAERIQTEKENFTKFAAIGIEQVDLGRADKTSLVMAVLDRPGVAAVLAAAVRRAWDQPPQAGVAAPPRQGVRVRLLRRPDGGGRRPRRRGGAQGGGRAHLTAPGPGVLSIGRPTRSDDGRPVRVAGSTRTKPSVALVLAVATALVVGIVGATIWRAGDEGERSEASPWRRRCDQDATAHQHRDRRDSRRSGATRRVPTTGRARCRCTR